MKQVANEPIVEKIHIIGGYSRFVKIPVEWGKTAKQVLVKADGSRLILESVDFSF